MDTPNDSLTPSGAAELPPALVADLRQPQLERKGWTTTIAPNYIALFLWVAYFDQLARRTITVGGLGWSILSLGAAAMLGYLLLYYVPATWGQRTGRSFSVLASSTFGARGSEALAYALFGLAQVAWLAVATYLATDFTFEGLVSLRLLDARVRNPMVLGSVTLANPLFLLTSLAWLYAAVLVGHYLVRIIAALMNVYPVFPALMLALAAVLTLRDVPAFHAPGPGQGVDLPFHDGRLSALVAAIEWFFGFFAMSGLAAADWGAVNRTSRDVRVGGWVGVILAPWTVAALALLTVAGAHGHYLVHPVLKQAADPESYTFRVAVVLGVERRLAGAMLLIFGLASLAPTCFAGFVVGQKLHAVWPRISRLRWTLLAALAAWGLIATRWASHLDGIYAIFGAVFTPMAGALVADYVYSRGVWAGPRRGVSAPGLVAWFVGMSVGLTPLFVATRLRPAPLLAFAAAFLVYMLLARIGLEPPPVAIADAVGELTAKASGRQQPIVITTPKNQR